MQTRISYSKKLLITTKCSTKFSFSENRFIWFDWLDSFLWQILPLKYVINCISYLFQAIFLRTQSSVFLHSCLCGGGWHLTDKLCLANFTLGFFRYYIPSFQYWQYWYFFLVSIYQQYRYYSLVSISTILILYHCFNINHSETLNPSIDPYNCVVYHLISEIVWLLFQTFVSD